MTGPSDIDYMGPVLEVVPTPPPEAAYVDDDGVPRDFDGEPIHGFTADGRPKKVAGRPRGVRATSRRSRAARDGSVRNVAAPQPKPAAKKTTPTTSTRSTAKKPNYTEGITKILSGLGSAAVLAPDPWSLDGMALLEHSEGLAEGVNELAGEIPAVAAACEKVLRAAPTFKIVSALLAFGAQVLVNHRIIPEHLGAQAGARTVDTLRGARDVMLGRIVQGRPEHAGQQQDVYAAGDAEDVVYPETRG